MTELAAAPRRFGDIEVTVGVDFVSCVELQRPPDNYFDLELIQDLANAYETLADDPACRVILLCASGRHFCAGANFASRPTAPLASSPAVEGQQSQDAALALYTEAIRVFAAKLPVVAAVQGAAIGGGLGLACAADFRVASPEARFSANFSLLGFHQGFGLSATLPRIVGQQVSLDLLYTGRRITGEQAHAIGLCDRLVPAAELRTEARAMAAEIARAAPLAVVSIRETMRADLMDEVRRLVGREAAEQRRLRATQDWVEGLRAARERRSPEFRGN